MIVYQYDVTIFFTKVFHLRSKCGCFTRMRGDGGFFLPMFVHLVILIVTDCEAIPVTMLIGFYWSFLVVFLELERREETLE